MQGFLCASSRASSDFVPAQSQSLPRRTTPILGTARAGERAHLFDLARAAHTTTRTRRRPAKQRVRPSVQRILDAMTAAPAFVRNGRMDLLGRASSLTVPWARRLRAALPRPRHRLRLDGAASSGAGQPREPGTAALTPVGELRTHRREPRLLDARTRHVRPAWSSSGASPGRGFSRRGRRRGRRSASPSSSSSLRPTSAARRFTSSSPATSRKRAGSASPSSRRA
jgi:hypothetical protein